MTFTVIKAGRDADLMITLSMITPTVAWHLATAMADVMSPTEFSPYERPSVTVVIDGTTYPAYVDTVCVTSVSSVEFVILRTDSYAAGASTADTSYFIRVSRTDIGWETAPNIVVTTNDGGDVGFNELELPDRLAFFFVD